MFFRRLNAPSKNNRRFKMNEPKKYSRLGVVLRNERDVSFGFIYFLLTYLPALSVLVFRGPSFRVYKTKAFSRRRRNDEGETDERNNKSNGRKSEMKLVTFHAGWEADGVTTAMTLGRTCVASPTIAHRTLIDDDGSSLNLHDRTTSCVTGDLYFTENFTPPVKISQAIYAPGQIS